jgi:4-hydroxybenzoate polyprenyltransferase
MPSFINSLKILFMSRKSMAFIYTWTAAVGALIAGRGFPPMQPTLLAMGASLFITMSVYLYNDIIDREMDSASPTTAKQNRPMANGQVPVSHAMNTIYLFTGIGLVMSYLVSIPTFIVSIIFFVLFSLYSFPKVRFKKMFIIKSLVTSTGPSFTMLIAGVAVGGFITSTLLFASVVQAAFMFFVLPGLADSFDLEEDRAYGMKTMAMVLNWTQKVYMMIFAVILVFVAGLVGYYYLGFNLVLPGAVSILSAVLFIEIVPLLKGYNESEARKVRKFAYAYFTLVPVFMALGSISLSFL